MIKPKRLQFFLLVFVLPFVFCNVRAQGIDENTYLHKMHLMDSLSLYKMKDYDTLYRVSVVDTTYGNNYKYDYYGWISNRSTEHIQFINTDGRESEIDKKRITLIKLLPIIDTTIEFFINMSSDISRRMGNFGKNYLLSLWLFEKGKFDYSKKLLPKNDSFFSDADLRDDFGIIYYSDMLSAFSEERNYSKAIKFGEHLSGNIFNGYKYKKEAIALTQQLKRNTQYFKAFHLPDSLEWNSLKHTLNRNSQVTYLADRLRLLNCIQDGQPGNISYNMYQFSISYGASVKLQVSYWRYNAKYAVINPFNELVKMELTPREIELLLPYLLSEDYIASYNFFRDFMPSRNLHKVSWVVNSLIYEITNKLFFKQNFFDSLTPDQKKAEVEKIKKWCDDNAALSKEDLTIKILKTADQWSDFHQALETARREKYKDLLVIIVERFNDFKGGFWPTNKGIMAKTMYDLGDGNYIEAVKKWSKDTTDIWVNLWSSLYLLKHDKNSYDPAMNELQSVLKQCDGTAYYPYAMDLLLNIDDKRSIKLAEGILDKSRFSNFIYWDYYLNFVKKLLLLKSDYTFNFINDRLSSFTPEETQQLNNNGGTNMLMQSDFYVLAVDKLKNGTPGYNPGDNIEMRLKYKKALSKWFTTQYNLLKSGKPNGLLLNVVPVNTPVTFIDSPH